MKITVSEHIGFWNIELEDKGEYFVARAYSRETVRRFAKLLRAGTVKKPKKRARNANR
jgi:hypothetical protein